MPESLELHKDIQTIKHDIGAQKELVKTLLSLQSHDLLKQKAALFVGKQGPRESLIKLYLAIGSRGKTRKELEDEGFSQGTIRPYLIELTKGAVVRKKETRPDGQDVFVYTVIEEITNLSSYLNSLLNRTT